MMRVRMLSLSAGPNGIYHPGQTYDLEDDFARSLVTGGYAVPVRVSSLETAMLYPSPVLSPKGRGEIEVAAAVSVETVGRKKPGKVK